MSMWNYLIAVVSYYNLVRIFFLGSIVSFFCLTSVIGYLITNYILDQLDLEKKYSRIGKYINRFKKIALFYVFIDLFICLLWLFLLVLLITSYNCKNSTFCIISFSNLNSSARGFYYNIIMVSIAIVDSFCSDYSI